MNTCSCLNLILACIVYWKACDPLANRIDLCLLEQISPIERDNVALYDNISSTGSIVRQRRPQRGASLAYKITRISLVP